VLPPVWRRVTAALEEGVDENYRLGISLHFYLLWILLKSIYKIWSLFKVSLKSENSLGVIYKKKKMWH
jgi:hypothetical protein